jgi:glycine/D-amino acid oxidase-like deaminating enzyme
VTGAETHGGRISHVLTTRGAIAADWVVNATNAWAPRVSARLGGMPLPIAPLKRYLYGFQLSRPIPGVADWRALPMTIYGVGRGRGAHSRPEAGQDPGRLLLAWAHETPPEPDFADADQDAIQPGFHHAVFDEAYGDEVNYGYAILRQACDFAPQLADCGGVAATTSGYYATTPDANPLIGFDTQLGNLVHAAGFSGHGLMHAPITAALVAALLTGEARDGVAQLPDPFARHSIAIATFAPDRDFAAASKESLVL